MMHQNDAIIVIDVRNFTEYELGHLNKSISIPLPTLENRTAWLQEYINDPVIVYCSAGSRSAIAAQILVNNNFTNVYNMLGGITAWMQAGNKIYTSYHHITADYDREQQKPLIDIEPFLLYQASCTTCQNQTACESSFDNTLLPENVTSSITNRNDTNVLISSSFDVNGTTYNMLYNRTLLWSYEHLGNVNRTAFLVSTEITMSSEGMDNITLNTLTISYAARSAEYKVTLYTEIKGQYEDNYEQAATIIAYMPANESQPVVSKETVQFNSSVSLLEKYAVLIDACKETSKTYKHSVAQELRELANGYHIMSKETKRFLHIAEQNIQEYNKPILNCSASLLDSECTDSCNVVCGLPAGGICTVLCVAIAAQCGPLWPACLAGCMTLCGGGIGVTCQMICDVFCGEEINWETMDCSFYCGGICIWCPPGAGILCDVACGWLCGIVCDTLKGDPPPPVDPPPDPVTYWVSSITQYGTWGSGAVNNPNGLTGSSPDGSYVQLWGGNYGDGGQIVGWMNQVAHGDIWLYCYSGTGYYTHIYTYVSYNNNNDWTQTSVQTVYGDGSGAHWIKFGSYSGAFRYIAIAAIDDNGMSANIFVDAVNVIAY